MLDFGKRKGRKYANSGLVVKFSRKWSIDAPFSKTNDQRLPKPATRTEPFIRRHPIWLFSKIDDGKSFIRNGPIEIRRKKGISLGGGFRQFPFIEFIPKPNVVDSSLRGWLFSKTDVGKSFIGNGPQKFGERKGSVRAATFVNFIPKPKRTNSRILTGVFPEKYALVFWEYHLETWLRACRYCCPISAVQFSRTPQDAPVSESQTSL